MKHIKQGLVNKLVLIAVAALLLLATGCGSNTGNAPAGATAAPTAEVSTTDIPRPLGQIDPETARLNVFLTSIVQQNIVDTRTDLDEDAEMVRFVFGYRKTNDPQSILEQEDDGVSCHTLTLEQVNETLTKLFGKSISPDQEDYSILSDEDESANFHCFYRNGVFWNVPPYPAERYPFPIRFALVSNADEETGILQIRLYRVNPWSWGEGEAERHIGVCPFMTLAEAEGRDSITGRDWISNIGNGYATLHDHGDHLELVEMVAEVED